MLIVGCVERERERLIHCQVKSTLIESFLTAVFSLLFAEHVKLWGRGGAGLVGVGLGTTTEGIIHWEVPEIENAMYYREVHVLHLVHYK